MFTWQLLARLALQVAASHLGIKNPTSRKRRPRSKPPKKARKRRKSGKKKEKSE